MKILLIHNILFLTNITEAELMPINVLEITIPSLITIFGFFINYRLLKKQKNLDINKYKNEEQIKKIMDIPTEILFFINCYMHMMAGITIDEKKFNETKKSIFDTILCYGSESATKLLFYFKYVILQGLDDGIDVPCSKIIAPLVLLIMQIKYDITNIKTSPVVWYVPFMSQKMLETNFYDISMKEINDLVDLLDLEDFLRITDNEIY